MKKRISILLFSILSLTIIFTGCSKNRPVDNYISISRYLGEKPIPFDSIKEFYKKSALKKELVLENKKLDQKVEMAIENGIKKIKPHIQKQILSKDIQKHFCKKLTLFFKKDFDKIAEKNIRIAQKYYDVIVVLTAGRRIRYLETFDFKTPDKNLIHSLVVPSKFAQNYSSYIGERGDMFNDLVKAKITKSKDRYIIAMKKIEEYTVYVYYLALLYELDGIEKYRDNKLKKAEEKQLEGKIFFDIVDYYAMENACKYSHDEKLCKNYKKLKNEFNTAIAMPVKEMDIPNLLKISKGLFPFFYK